MSNHLIITDKRKLLDAFIGYVYEGKEPDTESSIYTPFLSLKEIYDSVPDNFKVVMLNVTNKSLSAPGNQDVNELTAYLQEKMGKTLDGTIKDNRRYCYNLIRKIKKDYPDKDPIKAIKVLIDLALADDFHSINATSFKYIYYNTQKIITLYQQKNKKESTKRKILNKQLEDADKYQRNTLVATKWLSFCDKWLDEKFGAGNWSMKQKFANLKSIKLDYETNQS